MQFWNELEGRTIDGRYPLRRLVRSEGRSAWFETETGEPKNIPATISLTEALTDADEVTARLQAAQNLPHPNLVSISEVGQTRIDDTLVVYAVMEHIEQSLSDVLQTQALSAEEGREVAEALVGALTAIHQKGMSHGHVEAASVLATEETVKLRSDCLQLSPASQAADVAGIGATLFHAFTQRKALTAADAQINRIPAPFAEIVRNSLSRRWTLGQIANALKPAPPPVSSAIPPAAVPARPQPEPVVVKVPVPAAPAVAVAKPVSLASRDQRVTNRRRPVALYAALAVGVLAIIGWLFLRPSSAPPAATPQATTQAAAPTIQPAPAAAAPVAAPHKNKPAPSAPVARPVDRSAESAAPAGGRSIWRVVAYTYKSQQKAADMVAKISGQHADLGASVFSPSSNSGVYLVTVGGAMDHSQALKMRDKARSDGLPEDSYVQNFSE